MFGKFFSKPKPKKIPHNTIISRRRFPRREVDQCVGVIDGQTFPIDNWSAGGLLINADSRMFGVNDTVDVILKFKLSRGVIDVIHKARVVRKSSQKVAFEFAPLTAHVQNMFQNVVDDYVVSKFADSQMA